MDIEKIKRATNRLVNDIIQCFGPRIEPRNWRHNNGPSLHRIFGKVAGKQPGFEYYSATFRNAIFVWTPALLDAWLADPRAMFPESAMMSLGVPDPQRRADLIAYLKRASVREP